MNPNSHMNYDPKQLARKRGDLTVLIITIVIVVLGVFVYGGQDLIFLVVVSILFFLVMIRLQQISILANAMRVQNGRHAELAKMANEFTTALNAPPVDIYITQDPVLNAYALGYTRPFTIVLNSSVVEELSTEEVKAILLHEIGHIIYHHTILTSYIGPLAVTVPIIGPILNWVFGFWYRRAELACDRLAVAYLRDPHNVCMALIKIHVGSKFGKYMEEEGVLYQDQMGRNIFRKMSQTLSTHPFLVTRVNEVLNFCSQNNIQIPQHVIDYVNGTANGPNAVKPPLPVAVPEGK